MKKIVSIIIPVYNAESTLRNCVDSVREQTYTQLEILLIDDGSKDDSLIICEQYATLDNRVVVLHHDNHGVSYTRNRGLDRSTGDYIMFVDADDTISPNWVERYVTSIANETADLVIGGVTEIRADGNRIVHIPSAQGHIGTKIWKLLCETGDSVFGYVPNKIYKKKLIDTIRFDEKMTVQEDLAFAVDAYARTDAIITIDEAGYYYNYEADKRKTPFLDLIRNQIKIYSCATPFAEQYNIVFSRMSERVIAWTFQYLFESDLDDAFQDKCMEARKLQKLALFVTKRKLNEKTIIYYLVELKHYGIIEEWFRFRGHLKVFIKNLGA